MTEEAALADDDVIRAAVDDILVRGGQALVLVDSEVSLLSLIASSVVSLAAKGVTVDALADTLFDLYGAPASGDTSAAVRTVLAPLLAAGIVVRDT